VNGIGTAFAPSALTVSRKTGLWIVRTFRPWMSSSLRTGRLLLLMLRKPLSQ
jgi:hypothetical protein